MVASYTLILTIIQSPASDNEELGIEPIEMEDESQAD